MSAPTTVYEWATATGGPVLSGLTITDITWSEYAYIDVKFATADITAIQPSHILIVANAGNAVNNGRFVIIETNPAEYTVRIRNTARISTTTLYDETGITASGSVEDDGAQKADIPIEKQQNGFFDEEAPSAGQLNSMFGNVFDWITYFAEGGALPSYPSAAAVAADPAPANGAKILVAGLGLFEFDDSSTLATDSITILGHSSGGDGRYLLRIGQGWSRYFADGAALKAIDTTPLDASCLYRATINVAGLVREYIWIPTGSATAGEPTHYTPDDGPGFWAQVNEQAINYAPAVTTLAVNKTAHGFSALNVVRHNGTTWVTAQANTEAACMDCWIVSTVLDVDNFVAVKVGRVTIPAHGLTPGSTYYLSAASAGALTATIPVGSTTVPLGFYLPVIYVVDANTIDVLGQSRATKNKLLAEYLPSSTTDTSTITFTNLDVHSYGGALEWEISLDGNGSNTTTSFSLDFNGLNGSNKYNITEFRGAGANNDSNYWVGTISANSGSWNFITGRLRMTRRSGFSGPVYIETEYVSILDPGNRNGHMVGYLRDNVANVTQWRYVGNPALRLSSTAGHFIRLYRGDA